MKNKENTVSDKKKKQKTVYIDDGRTIADMSGVSRPSLFGDLKPQRSDKQQSVRKSAPRVKGMTKFETYKNAVRMMLVPMLVTIGIITLAYLLIYLML